ncbi:MAG: hypothetical protein U0X39_03165 [Bacteroidales bacterium]
MKNIRLLQIVMISFLVFSMISCEKQEKNKTDQAEVVKKMLEIEARMNALNAGTGKMTSFMSVIGYSQFRNGTLDIGASGSEPGVEYPDSLLADTTKYWAPVTCAKVTETDNEDGTHTTVYDYGDGCEEYGSLIRGKITYIWKNDANSYYSVVIYDKYYSYGMEMNGVSKYSFTSDGNSYYTYGSGGTVSDSVVSIMPVFFNWSGSSTGREDISMKYDDGNVTVYKSEFSNVWDSISYKVLQGDYYYSSDSEGYEYHYEITSPLVTSYKCTDTWVPVKGVESITTTADGTTSTYVLDYGDGTCDNLAKLTENGKTSVVDFGEMFRLVEVQTGATMQIRQRE